MLIEKLIPELLPIATKIINLSFEIKIVLQLSNHNATKKKSNLDNEVLKNYRTLANLPFLAKTVESARACQIQEYLITHTHTGKMQSA